MFPKPIVVIMMCVKSNHYVGHFRFTVLYVSYISIKWEGKKREGKQNCNELQTILPKVQTPN